MRANLRNIYRHAELTTEKLLEIVAEERGSARREAMVEEVYHSMLQLTESFVNIHSPHESEPTHGAPEQKLHILPAERPANAFRRNGAAYS